MNLARTIRTVRHLRPAQVCWRLRYRLERRRPAVVPRVPEGIELRDDFPDVPLVLHDEESDASNADDLVARLEQGRFRHLGETRTLGRGPTDWLLGDVAENRLWAMTLHYHGWAWELAERVARGGNDAGRADVVLRSLLGDWIENCGLEAAGSRDLAWNSYAIATRIGWWRRLYQRLGREGRKNWGKLEKQFIRSLWCQAAYLARHVEWDLRANHVLRDAVGLAWAGRFFHGPEAKQWLATATDMALEQAKEQVLSDGGHFERSPMYHVQAMEDLLALAALVEDHSVREKIRETWRSMAEFLAWVRHPDGRIPLFNDAALNGACRPRDMLSVGCRALDLQIDSSARRGGKFFDKFGLAVWHGGPWSVFFDVGPVGVDYQPGHAHADTLSLEASFEGERLFVDPGTFGYDDNESRRYDRSTASHNTVSIDGVDSSEVWGIFRLGRRARIVDVNFQAEGGSFRASASHTGYFFLSGSPCHTRGVEVTEHGALIITDHISGTGRHTLEGGLLLAPGCRARQTGGGWDLFLRDKHLRATIETVGDMKIETIERTYSPEFGRRLDVQRLAYSGEAELPCTTSWRIEARPARAE